MASEKLQNELSYERQLKNFLKQSNKHKQEYKGIYNTEIALLQRKIFMLRENISQLEDSQVKIRQLEVKNEDRITKLEEEILILDIDPVIPETNTDQSEIDTFKHVKKIAQEAKHAYVQFMITSHPELSQEEVIKQKQIYKDIMKKTKQDKKHLSKIMFFSIPL